MGRLSLLIWFVFSGLAASADVGGGSKVLPTSLRAASGRVRCPGLPRLGQAAEAEGFVFGNASEQFVLTPARVLVADDGTVREPLKLCTFTSHGADRRAVTLAAEVGPRTYGFGGFDVIRHAENDFAIVRLSRPLDNVVPFRFEAYPMDFEAGKVILALTFDGDDLRLDGCVAERELRGTMEHPEVATHDCALPEGRSSGLALARRDGRLVPVGLITSPRALLGLSDRVLDLAQRVMGVSF